MGIPGITRRGLFWKNRTVFITGVTGFVGSWLADRLLRRGARVIGLVRKNPPGSNFSRLGLQKRITVVRGRLENGPLLERALRLHAVEIVYHLGAQAIVGKANLSPRSTFAINIEGTWNLLEACRRNKLTRAVIVASSDRAYGTYKKLPLYPHDVSKACAELIARSYYFTFGLPVVITQFSNLYGPGDLHFSRIVPDTIRRVLRGKPPVLRSDGTPKRCYLYIDDAVDLYLLLAERIEKTRGDVFNAGHNKPVSVQALVEMILQLAGRRDLQPKILGTGTPRGEIDRQRLDGSKVKRILSWEPRTPLKEGLRRTLRWYSEIFPFSS